MNATNCHFYYFLNLWNYGSWTTLEICLLIFKRPAWLHRFGCIFVMCRLVCHSEVILFFWWIIWTSYFLLCLTCSCCPWTTPCPFTCPMPARGTCTYRLSASCWSRVGWASCCSWITLISRTLGCRTSPHRPSAGPVWVPGTPSTPSTTCHRTAW